MALPRFGFKNAGSFEEAVESLKACGGKVKVISGGTDLLHGFKDNIYKEYPEMIVNLRSIPDAEGIEKTENGVRIKGLTTLHELESSELLKEGWNVLAEAAYNVASPQIRNNSTIGGNICQEPRCWYYRNVDGLFNCLRKGGSFCNAQTGRNEIHSIFGSMKVKDTPCQESCPAGNAIPEYFAKLRSGDEKAAAEILLQTNPLAAVTGRICPHTCMGGCNRNNVDESVAIRSVEGTVGDYMLAHSDELMNRIKPATGKKAAVIGAGPAGLAAAYFLRLEGHAVVVFEQMDKVGGMMRYGIPSYRLSDEVLDRQVNAFEKMGIEFRTGVKVGEDITLKTLRQDYDAVFLGTGAWSPVSIRLDGEEYTIPALQLLRETAMGKRVKPGEDVIVIGGGNVAVDAAMVSRRLGAKRVRMICLESREQMPAFEDDIHDALEDGVEIIPTWGPDKVLVEDGKIKGLEMIRCTSTRDAQGRFSPVYDREQRQTFEADSIILAVGQKADLSYIDPDLGITGRIVAVEEETQKTAVAGLYAGGESASGPSSVVKAMAAGKRAAASMNEYLGGTAKACTCTANSCKELNRFHRSCLECSKAGVVEKYPQAEYSFAHEDAKGFTKEQAQEEINRCFNCGCVAVNPSDLAPALIALDAVVETTERKIDAEKFFTVGVQSSTVLNKGEIVTGVLLPEAKENTKSCYMKFRRRKSIDFPLLSTAVSVTMDGGKVTDARIVLGAVAPVPLRMREAEQYLIGKELTEETALETAKAALKDALPLRENIYKIQVTRTYLKRALLQCR
ncbi:MAG: FAD binding domain-containing protein [Eubacteriales bacterium]|nr:FAD binding domain-containing protein [Eubacteriales bacterium]